MSPLFADDLLARVEDAGINASAPREQLWVDGWLLRFSPGKAKRARCIQPVAAGRLPVEVKMARCLSVFAEAGLRPYVRITPFAQPAGLDAWLAAHAMERIDDSQVMVADLVAPQGPEDPQAGRPLRFEHVDGDRYADWVGAQRGSTALERRAHAERLRHSPVRYEAVLATDVGGGVIAGGQMAMEGDLAGLYDVFTIASWRGRGAGRALCRALLDRARRSGARIAYLQVDAANAPARRIYDRLGFRDAYSYHYRTPAAD